MAVFSPGHCNYVLYINVFLILAHFMSDAPQATCAVLPRSRGGILTNAVGIGATSKNKLLSLKLNRSKLHRYNLITNKTYTVSLLVIF